MGIDEIKGFGGATFPPVFFAAVQRLGITLTPKIKEECEGLDGPTFLNLTIEKLKIFGFSSAIAIKIHDQLIAPKAGPSASGVAAKQLATRKWNL